MRQLTDEEITKMWSDKMKGVETDWEVIKHEMLPFHDRTIYKNKKTGEEAFDDFYIGE